MRGLKFVGYLFALLLVIIITAFFFIDNIAKYVIEEEGTKAVKARVEVESVDVRFFPPGASLNGLKVTNPQEPMTNAFEASRIDANVDWKPLLKTKVIVETAALEGMRFNTPRQDSGAVPGLTPPPSQQPSLVEEFKQDFKLPAIEVPQPEELLARADLKTVAQAKALQQSIAERKQAWQQRIDSLPDEETVKSYKTRFKKLKEAKNPLEKLEAVAKLKELQRDAKQDLEKVKDARADLDNELTQLRKDMAALKAAPQEDMQRLLALAGLNPDALQGLAKALFGDEVANWINNAYAWYARLQPYISGTGEGEAETAEPDTTDYSDGLPKFLVKTLNISGYLPLPQQEVPFSGEFNNLTDRADVWGKPAKLALQSQAQGVGQMDFKGVLDHVVPSNAKDKFSFDLKNFPVHNIVFSDKEAFPVTLTKAIAMVAGEAEIAGGKLGLNVDTQFLQVQLANLLEQESAPLKKALLDTLKNVNQFSINLLASGAIQNPQVKITSSLDELLSQSVKGLVESEKKKLSGQLQVKLDALANEKLGGLNEELKGLVDLNALLQQRVGEFSGLSK